MTHGHEGEEEGSLWDRNKKKTKEGETRKGHVARRRRVGRWEEISNLDQICEREGEEEKKKKKEGRRKTGEKKKKKGEEGKREFPGVPKVEGRLSEN